MIVTESRITSPLARRRMGKSRTVFAKCFIPFLLGSTMLLGGCQSSDPGAGAGSSLKNFLLYGGATVPAEASLPQEDAVCPTFDVFHGGSSVRSGEGPSLRHQLSIQTTARECITHADGSYTVNIGVEVLALLGPAGRPGTYSTPLHIAIKRGNTVLSSRTRQVSVVIPAGEAQGITRIVEEGLPLPDNNHDVLIEIGLGSARPAHSRVR